MKKKMPLIALFLACFSVSCKSTSLDVKPFMIELVPVEQGHYYHPDDKKLDEWKKIPDMKNYACFSPDDSQKIIEYIAYLEKQISDCKSQN